VIKAISLASGRSAQQVIAQWKKSGDLGDTAQQLLGKKSQNTLGGSQNTVTNVFDNLQKLASMGGQGTVDRKVGLIAQLLTQATPREAKYIVRTVIGEVRAGVGEGTLRDAIVWAFSGLRVAFADGKISVDREAYDAAVQTVDRAFQLTHDFGFVAQTAKEQGLAGLSRMQLRVGVPLKAMLFQKVGDVAEGFAAVGKPCAIEFKYDGFRIQIHKSKTVRIFTRRMEDVTKQFPDIVKEVNKQVHADTCILDCEAVGIKDGHYLPFQQISQRIKRKHDIEAMAKEHPVRVCVFDVLQMDGKSLLGDPFEHRRKILNEHVKQDGMLMLAEQIMTDDQEEAEAFYKKSLAAGNEGVMMKNLSSVYSPGSRVGFGVKVKPTMETLECVIVGADWGEGKRSKWLASFTLAVRDRGRFLAIGKMGTGIKEKASEGVSFAELTKLLKPLIAEEHGRAVHLRPSFVVEVDYEEIQKSPTYESGYALRFPRFVRLRVDRGPDDVSTLHLVEKLYAEQRGRT